MLSVYSILVAAVPLLLWAAYSYIYSCRITQHAHLPRSPPSLIWGHLATIGDVYKKGDARRHIDYVFRDIGQSIGTPPLFILDMRPFFWVMCIVLSHEVAEQVSRGTKNMPYSAPKSPTMGAYTPLIGPHSIVTAQGEKWKSLRKRFNAGFAPSHLLKLLPRVLEKTSLFLQNLDALAKSGDEFPLEPLCTTLTFDIIGAAVMDVDLDSQLPESQQSELVKEYRKLLGTYAHDGAEGFILPNPFNYLRRMRTAKKVDEGIKALIREKFAALSSTATTTKARSVLTLSLQDVNGLDPLNLQQIADTMKSFLFAGHDTTSILLQWAFYELSRTPKVLAKLRAEHDELFGPDADPAVVTKILLEKGDEVISKMSYTSAVIKEILRMYPPAGTARMVPTGSGFFVKLPDGTDVCLDGLAMYNMHSAIQRDPAVYGSTSETFVPERWIGDVDTSATAAADDYDEGVADDKANVSSSTRDAKIPPSAWRAFERGPRNCIGQELANLEARVILALAVRRYDFTKVGAGKLKVDVEGKLVIDESTGQYEVESPMFNTRQVTSKPFDKMMMKVALSLYFYD